MQQSIIFTQRKDKGGPTIILVLITFPVYVMGGEGGFKTPLLYVEIDLRMDFFHFQPSFTMNTNYTSI